MKKLIMLLFVLLVPFCVHAQSGTSAVKPAVTQAAPKAAEPSAADLKLLVAQQQVEITELRKRLFILQGILNSQNEAQAEKDADAAHAALDSLKAPPKK